MLISIDAARALTSASRLVLRLLQGASSNVRALVWARAQGYCKRGPGAREK